MTDTVAGAPGQLSDASAPAGVGREKGMGLGVVVIGRNEGERLRRCLMSIGTAQWPVVYVDSGSTDESVAAARALGARVEILDPALGFTAARARNLGWRSLLLAHPDLQFIQFVDGDCQVDGQWLSAARAHLVAHPAVAGVCGRRRELFPAASVYNGLCDVEWNTPIGETLATGGDALFRVDALRAVDGYRDTLIAGEEPEMCLRMRAAGWSLERLDLEMTGHDAAMTTFSQWWRRAQRAGHAYAEGHHLHGGAPHFHYRREVVRSLLWALAFPMLIAALGLFSAGWGLWLFLIYPVQFVRLWRRNAQTPSVPAHLAAPLALSFVLGRFAELQGLWRYYRTMLAGRRSVILEYK